MENGRPLGNMIIKLDLDNSGLTKNLNSAKNAFNHQMKAMQSQMKVMNASGNALGVLEAKYNGLGSVLQTNNKQIELLTKSYNNSFDANGKATASTVKYANQLNQATARSASYESQMKMTVGQIARMKVETEGVTGGLKKQSDEWIRSGKKIETFGNQVSSAGTTLTIGVTAPLIAGATAVTTAAISWESAFAGVKKTNDEVVDSTGKVVYSYQDLENGLRGLAKKLPASHQEIANVAETAGQLGIKTENVVSFTKTMIDMGESTNMSAETAATSLARLANITKLPQDKFSNLGAAIVDLGNNFATTEAEISEMALRLAGAGSQIGLSQGDILGLAAALSSVGIEAEMGGSAISKVMVNMQVAAKTGLEQMEELSSKTGMTRRELELMSSNNSKGFKELADSIGMTTSEMTSIMKSSSNLEDFGKIAGMSAKEFKKAFEEDAIGAIGKFIEGLGNAESQGTSAIEMLNEMGISEVRLRDSLLRAGNASDLFKDAVNRSNEAFEKNVALTDEANKRYETTESKLKLLKNEAIDAAIDLGGPFVDALRDGLQASKPLIKGLGALANSFSSLSEDQQRNIIKWLGIGVVAGPTLKLLGSGVSIIGKVTKSTGKLTGSLVELAAKATEKKAMESFSATVTATGTAAAKTAGVGGLGGLTSALGQSGSAASVAAGSSGIGALTGSLGVLGPALLGIVGAGGALAIGYGAWKTFGEEAWNSSQRVKDWGTDVGTQVDGTLGLVKEKTLETSGQFGLMAEGFNQNTEPMVKNFETIGATIESSLMKKVEGLDNLIKNLPGSVTDSMKQIVENEKEMNQSALAKIQENNDRIKEIREKASKEQRDISVAEAQMISDLSKDTAEQYVNTLDVSAEQRRAILSSMTGDVANATKEQAEIWLKSLGEQRNASKNHSAQMRKEQEKWLEEWGYKLDGEFAQKYLAEWDKINGATADGFDSQIAAIVEKYPELTDKIHLATGEVIEASAGASQYLIDDNQKLLDNAGYMADKLAENAKKTANTLKWVAKEGTDGAKEWNSLELIDKEGNVKTNAPEIIKEASKNITTWNNLKMVLHDANIDSNAKKMIGEAAIANNLWRGMAWEDKEAVLQDEFSVNVYKALESSGKWDELNFEQKKAVLYSNTPEVMAETLFNLGLWDKYQPEIKKLNAKNYDFLQVLSKSEEKLKVWNETPADIKELFAKNTDFLNKIFSSEESFKQWNAIPDSEKKLLADNIDFLAKISTSKEAFIAWTKIPEPIKRMLGDNVDILSKVKDGTIKINEYNKNVLPYLKVLLGDGSDLYATVNNATGLITNYNEKINPVQKALNTTSNASEVSSALDLLNASWDRIPKESSKKINVDFIGPIPNAKGTNFHPGGSALVNDQKGSVYEELIQLPDGRSFIPKGRNVVLDLPKGSKVLNATKTKRLIPKYADGVGNFTAISPASNLDMLILALNELVNVLKTQTQNKNSGSDNGEPLNKESISGFLNLEGMTEKSDQHVSIGVKWLNNLMSGWNSGVPQFIASENLFIENYQNALQLQDTPNYLQGTTWNKNLMSGWNSLTGTFITTINLFCNQALVTLRNYNTSMYSNGRNWQQNNLNGWNSLYGSFISKVNQVAIDSINNLRSKNSDFYNAGNYLMQSLINGLNSTGDSLSTTMNSVANKMVGGIGKGVNGVISGVNHVLKEVESSKTLGNWTVPQYAKGTESHPGGLAMINDQKGPVHEEYVQLPDGKGFIAKGRDLLVNLPKGAQVLNASLTKKLKDRLDVPRYEKGIGNLDIVDLLDNEKKMLEFLSSQVDFSSISEPWLDMTRSGTSVMSKEANTMLQAKLSEFFTHGNFDGSVNANGVYQYLVDVAQKVMNKFPGLTVTSGYRPGDAYYHGKRQALDLAYPGVSGDPRYTAAANYAFEKFPSKIAYVITNGRVRDRIGLSGTGSSGQWTNWPDGDHFDHIHLNGSMGAGNILNEGSSSGGVSRWRSYVSKSLKMNGLPTSSAYLNAWLAQIQTESGGNERAIGGNDGLADGNATGLLQTKPGTFAANAFPGHGNIMNGFDNMLAAMNYAKKRYGVAGMLQVIGRGHGYANGGLINKDGFYRAGEGNKPELVVPLTRKTRAIELIGQALAFLSGNEKKRTNTNSVDNTNDFVTLIKQQQKQHSELMTILQAILAKDPNVKISDVGEAANNYLGSNLKRLQYTKQ